MILNSRFWASHSFVRRSRFDSSPLIIGGSDGMIDNVSDGMIANLIEPSEGYRSLLVKRVWVQPWSRYPVCNSSEAFWLVVVVNITAGAIYCINNRLSMSVNGFALR